MVLLVETFAFGAGAKVATIDSSRSMLEEINQVSMSPENQNWAVFINNGGFSGTYEFYWY